MTRASDNADSQSIDGKQDLKESYDPEATSTQLDDLDVLLWHVQQEAFDSEGLAESSIAKIKVELLAWADTLAKEAIGGNETDTRWDGQWRNGCNSAKAEALERLSQLLNRGGDGASSLEPKRSPDSEAPDTEPSA